MQTALAAISLLLAGVPAALGGAYDAPPPPEPEPTYEPPAPPAAYEPPPAPEAPYAPPPPPAYEAPAPPAYEPPAPPAYEAPVAPAYEPPAPPAYEPPAPPAYEPPAAEPYEEHDVDVSAEGKAVNNPGMDATSKACRYDDGPGWSDCDPFDLIKFRVLKLIHGGSQCEEVKNITKHCTPMDFPYGTHWLIQEHRKCIAELNRLKAMIGDLHKFIETLHEKGKELFSAYQKLKSKLKELNQSLDKLKMEGEHQQEVLQKLKEEIEEWKTKARELQIQLDDLKAKFHDLESEDHELTMKNEQLQTDINIIEKENEGIRKRIEKLARNNEELRKRIVESEHTKEKVKIAQAEKSKLENKLEGAEEMLQRYKDELTDCRIKNMANSMPQLGEEGIESKDTHVDLSMEMYITHNKTVLYEPTYAPVVITTEKPEVQVEEKKGSRCLVSYYGYTNETCWYETDGEKSEDSYVDALGHHIVEAHWKYFTIDVKDQYECDKASHLHYEFLLKRCSPKHYLPVLSVFKPADSKEKELGTHVYPKVDASGNKRTCWITFLGAHGHCEAHNQQYDMYNTDDTPEGYSAGSGSSKAACMARADWWMKFCETPVIVTYIPEGVSTRWEENWIMHDSHGGRMFEDSDSSTHQVNPDSLKPYSANPSQYKSEYKSQEPKSPDYHDSPEYRKSLHLEGAEKELLLQQLRARLGMPQGPAGFSKDVQQYGPSVVSGGDGSDLAPVEEPAAPAAAVYAPQPSAPAGPSSAELQQQVAMQQAMMSRGGGYGGGEGGDSMSQEMPAESSSEEAQMQMMPSSSEEANQM